MENQTIKKVKRNVIIFIIVTLISGWLGVLVDRVLTDQPEGNSLGMGLWLVLPFVTALILRGLERDWKSFGYKPFFKSNIKWYIVAIAIYPVMMIISTGLGLIFGYVKLSKLEFAVLIPLVVASLAGNLVKNIFEEFSWRGYLTPKLVELKINDGLLYLIVGLVWSLWHAAYYLVFLPDELYVSISSTRLENLFSSIVIMIIWGVMFVEMYRITHSVLPCILMHAMEDAIPTVLIQIEGVVQFEGVGEILLNPLTGIIPLIAYLLFGLWLRSQRIKINKGRDFTYGVQGN